MKGWILKISSLQLKSSISGNLSVFILSEIYNLITFLKICAACSRLSCFLFLLCTKKEKPLSSDIKKWCRCFRKLPFTILGKSSLIKPNCPDGERKLKIKQNLSKSSDAQVQFSTQLKALELKFDADWEPLKKRDW
jgi:hypothetical protein